MRKFHKSEHATLEQRFNDKVFRTSNCWFWLGPLKGKRYGKIKISGRNLTAHRIALKVFRGIEVPSNLDVMHECDTLLCVNPDHLKIGTKKENIRDSIRKGVLRPGRGISTRRYVFPETKILLNSEAT